MRDLIDHHEREMMLDLTGERRSVSTMGRDGAGEAVGGVFTGPATSVWSGGGNGRWRASERVPTWTRESAAVATLERLGYAWRGGQLWAPPIGGRTRLVLTPRVSEEIRP